jgi:hypothetical protein
MQTNRVPLTDGSEIGSDDPRSSFRGAFSQARLESRGVGVEMIRSKEPEFSTYEFLIEKRSGKRSSDTARWNKLGEQGWDLISVVGKQAFFRRVASHGSKLNV